MRRWAVAALAALALAGCSPRRFEPPSPATSIDLPAGSDLLGSLRARRDSIRGLRALARLTYTVEGDSRRARQILVAERPDRLRLEVLSPFGTVFVPLLSYVQMGGMMGWASAPYDPGWERRFPARAAAMALAGPVANVLLAAIAFAGLRIGLLQGAFVIPQTVSADRLVLASESAPALVEGLSRMLSVSLYLNVLLATFNLIPLPPMDGASVLGGLVAPLREPYARFRGSFLGAVGGMLGGVLVLGVLFTPIFRAVLRALFR